MDDSKKEAAPKVPAQEQPKNNSNASVNVRDLKKQFEKLNSIPCNPEDIVILNEKKWLALL